MKKIILNNKKEIEVLNANSCCFSVKATEINDVLQIFNDLTEENLEIVTIKEDETISEIFTNKCRSSVNYDGNTAIFYFNDVDITSKKIKELEDTVDMLVLSDMGIPDDLESEDK